PGSNAAPLYIAAAADLSPMQSVLSESIANATGIQVEFTFGSSGMLARQIENGAPFDLYLSANEQFAMALESRGKVQQGSPAVYGLGRLGLWSKRRKASGLDDLRLAAVTHIAIPNPALAPYGKAAQEMLKAKGLWTIVEPKVVYGENVLQTLQFAESGN